MVDTIMDSQISEYTYPTLDSPHTMNFWMLDWGLIFLPKSVIVSIARTAAYIKTENARYCYN